jgi:hypothetical protein
MQKFAEVDGGNPDGTAKDRDGVTPGTKYLAKYYNDNIFNVFEFVESQGYTLIEDDLSQLAKASKALYNSDYTYNTSAIATQSVNDVVLGSDGNYYEAQSDGINGDDPVGSVTGNWEKVPFDKNVLGLNNTTAFTPTANYHPATKKYVDDSIAGTVTSGVLSTDDYLYIQDQKASLTAGGTFTNGAWRTRDLNTILANTITGASLLSNVITLPAGTYYVRVKTPAFAVVDHQCRLYNITDATILQNIAAQDCMGTSCNTGTTTQTDSILTDTFTIAGTKDIRVEHRCRDTVATNGLGNALDFASSFEVYSDIEIWKVG